MTGHPLTDELAERQRAALARLARPLACPRCRRTGPDRDPDGAWCPRCGRGRRPETTAASDDP